MSPGAASSYETETTPGGHSPTPTRPCIEESRNEWYPPPTEPDLFRWPSQHVLLFSLRPDYCNSQPQFSILQRGERHGLLLLFSRRFRARSQSWTAQRALRYISKTEANCKAAIKQGAKQSKSERKTTDSQNRKSKTKLRIQQLRRMRPDCATYQRICGADTVRKISFKSESAFSACGASLKR